MSHLSEIFLPGDYLRHLKKVANSSASKLALHRYRNEPLTSAVYTSDTSTLMGMFDIIKTQSDVPFKAGLPSQYHTNLAYNAFTYRRSTNMSFGIGNRVPANTTTYTKDTLPNCTGEYVNIMNGSATVQDYSVNYSFYNEDIHKFTLVYDKYVKCVWANDTYQFMEDISQYGLVGVYTKSYEADCNGTKVFYAVYNIGDKLTVDAYITADFLIYHKINLVNSSKELTEEILFDNKGIELFVTLLPNGNYIVRESDSGITDTYSIKCLDVVEPSTSFKLPSISSGLCNGIKYVRSSTGELLLELMYLDEDMKFKFAPNYIPVSFEPGSMFSATDASAYASKNYQPVAIPVLFECNTTDDGDDVDVNTMGDGNKSIPRSTIVSNTSNDDTSMIDIRFVDNITDTSFALHADATTLGDDYDSIFKCDTNISTLIGNVDTAELSVSSDNISISATGNNRAITVGTHIIERDSKVINYGCTPSTNTSSVEYY